MTDQLRYESVLESISGGFFALDSAFRITYWNRAAESGTGMKAEEVLGKHVFEVFPNAEDAELGETYRLAMSTKTFQSIETSYKDDRFEAWYDVRIYPAEDGLSVFFQDITGKKKDIRRKEILVDISRAINTSQHLDELCVRAADKIALLFEIPSSLVCVYLYDPRGNEIRLVAPALMDVDLPPDVVHQQVREAAPPPSARVAHTPQVLVRDARTPFPRPDRREETQIPRGVPSHRPGRGTGNPGSFLDQADGVHQRRDGQPPGGGERSCGRDEPETSDGRAPDEEH